MNFYLKNEFLFKKSRNVDGRWGAKRKTQGARRTMIRTDWGICVVIMNGSRGMRVGKPV